MFHRLVTLSIFLLLSALFIIVFFEKSFLSHPEVFFAIRPSAPQDDLIAEDEFLILFKSEMEQEFKNILKALDLKILTPLGEWVHVGRNSVFEVQKLVNAASKESLNDDEIISMLKSHTSVVAVYKNEVEEIDNLKASCGFDTRNTPAKTSQKPSDPLFKFQWHLQKEQGIDVVGAWEIERGNNKTVLALVDRNFSSSGNDFSQTKCQSRQYYQENVSEYFKKRKIPLLNNDVKNHGDLVLSAVAPCTNNAVGISGIDWNAQVFLVDTKEDRSLSARMFALLWASGVDVCESKWPGCLDIKIQKNHHAANIINTSFGFAGRFLKDPPYAPVLDIIGQINRKGKIIVASAGNEGIMGDRRLPGSAGGVISIGASSKDGKSAEFSNYGRTVDVLAPGQDIFSFSSENQPISLDGTSFSAPIASGVVSLMLAANPNLSWKTAEYILKSSATPMSCDAYCPISMGSRQKDCLSYCCPSGKLVCASGIINAKRAVELAKRGIPAVPLVDVDDYFIPLAEESLMQAMIVVKNWGSIDALIKQKSTHKNLHLIPDTLKLSKALEDGVPATVSVMVMFDKIPKGEIITSLILEAYNPQEPQTAVDQIEAIVHILPTHKHRGKKLKELIP